MKLRFEVDQAACLRAGIDCPKSIITVEINPAKLPQKERDVIADRLEGIDVRKLANGINPLLKGEERKPYKADGRIVSKTPTYEGLLAAILENEMELEGQRKQVKADLALARRAVDNALTGSK